MNKGYEDHLHAAVRALKLAKQSLSDEISSYPTPISGCDAQFNHLLAERHRITAALSFMSSDVFIPTPRTPSPMSGVESR